MEAIEEVDRHGAAPASWDAFDRESAAGGGHYPEFARARAWWWLMYPGEPSCPDWETAVEAMRQTHVPIVISPLHEDANPATGAPKKSHRHVLARYSGKKSAEQVRATFCPMGAAMVEPVSDVRGAIRYLFHLDEDPSTGRRRYDPADAVLLSGMDISEYVAPTPSQGEAIVREMRQWARDEGCLDMATLLDHADAEEPSWARALDGSPRALRSMECYVRGAYNRRKRRREEDGAKA